MTSGLLLPSWLSVLERTRQQIVSAQQIPVSQIILLPPRLRANHLRRNSWTSSRDPCALLLQPGTVLPRFPLMKDVRF